MFCTYCGKPLEEGEVCSCRKEEGSLSVELESSETEEIRLETGEGTAEPEEREAETVPAPEEQTVPVSGEQAVHQQEAVSPGVFSPALEHWRPVEKKRPGVFARFGSVLAHYIPQPVQAIRQAGEFGDFGVGMLCCLFQAALLSAGLCFYLVNRVQVGYRLGFFEQAIPFGQYLVHAGSNLFLLFFQLFGVALLADVLLLFCVLLCSGSIGRRDGASKVIGGVGTALLMSGIAGIATALIASFVPGAASIALFGGGILALLAVWIGADAGTELSKTKLFYLLPLALLIWGGIMAWFVSCVPMLSWISGLIF